MDGIHRRVRPRPAGYDHEDLIHYRDQLVRARRYSEPALVDHTDEETRHLRKSAFFSLASTKVNSIDIQESGHRRWLISLLDPDDRLQQNVCMLKSDYHPYHPGLLDPLEVRSKHQDLAHRIIQSCTGNVEEMKELQIKMGKTRRVNQKRSSFSIPCTWEPRVSTCGRNLAEANSSVIMKTYIVAHEVGDEDIQNFCIDYIHSLLHGHGVLPSKVWTSNWFGMERSKMFRILFWDMYSRNNELMYHPDPVECEAWCLCGLWVSNKMKAFYEIIKTIKDKASIWNPRKLPACAFHVHQKTRRCKYDWLDIDHERWTIETSTEFEKLREHGRIDGNGSHCSLKR
ncbi:hypothetical protein H2198_001776 [Neophaeococcomyces mojaviensis]|uniref:Uncharacterized protein n=1 Tax=Neophaeococcomyces mojaviensis TaxID=3383035 RepID=A0ACC3AG75_9EURO|nr:hypothetical protein H2198_001776 [Knufia sp. JES_112]